MRLPSVLTRHPALAWLLPAAVAVALMAIAMGVFTATSSSDPLPETNPRALMAAVEARSASTTTGYAGTIVVDSALGISSEDQALSSAAPATGAGSSPDDSALGAFTTILSGSYTLRYWYGGPQHQRVTMLRQSSEADYFHNGSEIWEWDSASQMVSHAKATAESQWSLPMTFAALTPQELAERAFAAIDATTNVSLGSQSVVAGRPCYQLVITPSAAENTRIGSIRISVDGKTKVPLAAQIYARNAETPSIDVGFSTVRYKHPSSSYFSFTPPSTAVMTEAPQVTRTLAPSAVATASGSAWAGVEQYRGTAASLGISSDDRLKDVSGSWGSGQLLESPLVSVLVMKDGWIYLGSVDPAVLYRAATEGTTQPR